MSKEYTLIIDDKFAEAFEDFLEDMQSDYDFKEKKILWSTLCDYFWEFWY